MRILALDTATESCSAALLLDDRVLTRERLPGRAHAEVILPMADELLAQGGVSLKALTAIAFGRGPGAFTGVRLAASIAQGLAYGAGLPVVPISDLQALAQRALESDVAISRVLACADARMREVYWGCFERTAAGLAGAVTDEHVGKPSEVSLPAGWIPNANAQASSRRAAAGSPPPLGEVCGAGSGFAVYPELRAALGGLNRVLDDLLPRASEIARLAAAEVGAGRVFPPEQALPVYLRDRVTHGRDQSLN